MAADCPALALAFLTIGVARALWGVVDSTVLIALILIPILIYLIASGRLSEFKGPGAIEAKFAQTASATVGANSETIEFDDPEMIRKAHVRDLLALKKQEIDQTRPALLTMTVGKPRYDVDDLRQYLRVLTQFPNFRLVVFLDTQGRFVASMSPWSLKQLLGRLERSPFEDQPFEPRAERASEERALAEEFVFAINEGQRARLLRYPGVCTKTALTTATNAEALKQMLEQNIDVLAVVDTEGRVRGVVEREHVLSRLTLALVR